MALATEPEGSLSVFHEEHIDYVAALAVVSGVGSHRRHGTFVVPAADRIGVHAGASYLPFIVERLFAVFLAEHEKEFSAYKFALPAKEEGLNVHLKLLRQMKDLSVKNKSLWMATCWVNYRNLYMSNIHGAEWCRRYLKDITPTEFKYA